jgi:hypothetical protein
MNQLQASAINIMRADHKRKLYRGETGEYYLMYTKGIDPLCWKDVKELLEQGVIKKEIPTLERYELLEN